MPSHSCLEFSDIESMMAPDSWSDGDTVPSMADSHQGQVDRQMVRHLLSRYSKKELKQLLEEEGRIPVSNGDGTFIFADVSYSAANLEDAPSTFDSSASSAYAFSDTSSANGSNTSNLSARTAKLLHRKTIPTEKGRTPSDDASWDAEDATGSSNAPKQRGAFSCGFCSEEGIQKTCTRKNDLKRHIEDFHNTNAQWFCRHRGCHMVFDWQTAYKAHLKHVHGGSRMSLDDAKVDLCPQTVFACGFENCLQVFEASGDMDAPSTFKEYVSHVVKHFDEGSNSGHWSYSARIRNLLRQSSVLNAWSGSSWTDADSSRLRWHPHSSCIFRKRLETRHIGDLGLLIHYAVILGSGPAATQTFREDFTTPIRDQCPMTVDGHSMHSPRMSQAAESSPTEQDSFDFRVPRGADPDMTAASYYSSQRRGYAPSPTARAGRSARAHAHGLSNNLSVSAASPGTPPYSSFPNAPGAAQSMFDSDQIPLSQQQLMMAGQGGASSAGMLPDSLRSMRGIKQEPDVEMGEGHVAGAAYLQQYSQGFGHAYGSVNGLQSPVLTDGCGAVHGEGGVDQHGHFMAY